MSIQDGCEDYSYDRGQEEVDKIYWSIIVVECLAILLCGSYIL